MKILIKNCEVIDIYKIYPKECNVLVNKGIIQSIDKNIEYDVDEVIDGKGLKLLPGFIDMHVHLREPGYEYKENIRTGTIAAAKGGYTGICCMPNTNPVIDSVDNLKILLDKIHQDALIDVYPIASITKDMKESELTDFEALINHGAIAFSNDGLPVSSTMQMQKAMIKAQENNILIIEHCEDLGLTNGGVINHGKASERLKLKGISNLSELYPVIRNITLAELTNSNFHIAHISTKATAQVVRHAKKNNINISCEVTPHHIALCDDILEDGYTDCKVNPPLRTCEDIKELKEALADGTIDVIATDHAPHSLNDKSNDYYKSAFGISGIESAFSVCYTELVKAGFITLRDLVNKMSYTPAKLLGINRGRIIEGAVADLTLVDENSNITIDKNNYLSLGKNTPFHGKNYTGKVVYTIKDGKIVFNDVEKIES